MLLAAVIHSSTSIMRCKSSCLGFQLVSFDYSQLELRVLAYLSKDEKLNARLALDTDFFLTLAADLLRKPIEEITREQRQNAKQVHHPFSNIITCEIPS